MTLLYFARRAVLLTCVGAWVIAAVATHIPEPELSGIHVSDKTLHVVGYFGLASLFWLSLAAYGSRARRRLLTVLMVLAVYGVVDETTQALVHRTPDVADWLANLVGITAAIVLWETTAWLGRLSPPQVSKTPPGP
ncbi:MAG: VanZ family protein [Phycisphaerae bacterium]|nr:VanZ family protein [Phycisphaerae bacterium]